MFPKPHGCHGCPLEFKGQGFLHPAGPPKAEVLYVGEAGGVEEARRGYAFEGPAGGQLNKLLFFNDIDRKKLRLYNVVNCHPPGDWLDGAPWEHHAVAHCAPYLDQVLDEGHKVVVALGGTALRRLLDLPKRKGDGVLVKDFHGTVHEDPRGRPLWIVPTFHPSHLLRGASALTGVMLWDLQLAHGIARKGFKRPVVSLQEDPPVAWVRRAVWELRERALAEPRGIWCAVDVETPDKAKKPDEGELTTEDHSWRITRFNFAWSTEEGISFPAEGPYVELALEILALPLVFCFWNKGYDVPRLKRLAAERGVGVFGGPCLDFMVAWHVLQSDVPKGLGFVAPLFSDLHLAWKHLSASRPAYYGCLDGVQTLRVAHGIAKELQEQGQWDVFWRHMHLVREYAFNPATEVGLAIDREETERFQAELAEKQAALEVKIIACVPTDVLKLVPKEGWSRPPKPDDIAKLNTTRAKNGDPPLVGEVVEIREVKLVKVCVACRVTQVPKTHRCVDRTLTPDVQLMEAAVNRWYIREQFNPRSWPQVLAYILAKGHKPGKNRKTKKPTTDKRTIDRLAKTTRDPFYTSMKLHREVAKVKGTYVDGTLRRLDDPNGPRDGRVHGTVTDNPSTLRISMVDPNLTNVVADKAGGDGIAAGFRRCVRATSDETELMEIDLSAVEAVKTGYYAGDPVFYRLAGLGVHAYMCSLAPDVNDPADLAWDDARLKKHFAKLKEEHYPAYDREKRTVYLSLYGGTPRTMFELFPDVYRKLADAERAQKFFYSKAPLVEAFHAAVRERADRKHFLGGPGKPGETAWPGQLTFHPWGYRHWFWEVLTYRPITEEEYRRRRLHGLPVTRFSDRPYSIHHGNDYKRSVAYLPQSDTAGELREACLLLFDPESADFIGDTYYGKTPLRAPIHDSLLLEYEKRYREKVLERAVRVLTRPRITHPLPPEWGMGPYMTIGCEVKIGQNWAPWHAEAPCREGCKHRWNPLGMKKYPLPGAEVAGVVGDKLTLPDEDDDAEELTGDLTKALGSVVA